MNMEYWTPIITFTQEYPNANAMQKYQCKNNKESLKEVNVVFSTLVDFSMTLFFHVCIVYRVGLQRRILCLRLHMPHVKKDPSACEIIYRKPGLLWPWRVTLAQAKIKLYFWNWGCCMHCSHRTRVFILSVLFL